MASEGEWHQLYYDMWVEREGLDLIQGWVVSNIYTVPLKPWARIGGNAVHIQLEGTGGLNASQVVEIPAGKHLEPMKHLYEEMIYVLSGRGTAQVWYPNQKPHTFEWGPESLFSIPLNACFQLFNASGLEPARYFSVTTAPVMMNLLRDDDVLFNAPVTFPKRYSPEPTYFSEGYTKAFTLFGPTIDVIFNNLIPDISTVKLQPLPRGKSTYGAMFELVNGMLSAHVLQIPGGSLTKLHQHGPGAHVVWLEGDGYSMLGPSLNALKREDWGRGTLLVPPSWWWHQHLVTSSTPAKHLAFKPGGRINAFDKSNRGTLKSTREGGSQLDFNDVPPELRDSLWKEFAEACRLRGTEPSREEMED